MKKLAALLLLALALPAAALTQTRYSQIKGAPINVLDFGAKGDGTHDDTAAIQAAVTAAGALSLGSITDPYSTLALGGTTVYLPPGKYSTSNTIMVPPNVSIVGAGRNASVIYPTGNFPAFRNVLSAAYVNFGVRFEHFGIVGTRTGSNQHGIEVMRVFNLHIEDVVIQRMGGAGFILRECLDPYMANVESQMNVGAGIYVTQGMNSWSDTTPDTLPTNNGEIHNGHFAFNDGAGVFLDGPVNGVTFYGGSAEYNYHSSPPNTGYNVLIQTSNYTTNTFYTLWCEGPAKAHVYVNTADPTNMARFVDLHHFSLGSTGNVDRAVIVDKGTLLLEGPIGHGSPYKTISGSSVPFRLKKASATILLENARGNTITNGLFVEDETGATSGLLNNGYFSNHGRIYGTTRLAADFGNDTLNVYLSQADANPWFRLENWPKGLALGVGGATALDTWITRNSPGVVSIGTSINPGDANGYTAQAGVQLTPFTFAALPAVGNGTVVYCSNCTVAATCASGGNGALAKRLNNAWVCN